MADKEFRRALQHGLGPWPLVREAVSSTRLDRDQTHSVEAEPVVPACKECRDGKHTNCNGETWDTRTDDGFTGCPCAALGHPA